jgi:hypothetical protein
VPNFFWAVDDAADPLVVIVLANRDVSATASPFKSSAVWYQYGSPLDALIVVLPDVTYAPVPTALILATRNKYVPAVRSVSVAVVLLLAEWLNAV